MKTGNIKYIILTLTIILSSCKKEEVKTKPAKRDYTQEMVQELNAIATNQNNINVWHLNKKRAEYIDEILKKTTNDAELVRLLFKSGSEWLNAGKYNKSISRFNDIFSLIENKKLRLPPEAYYNVREVLGIAYLRKAEIENCVQNHNEFSCIIPIQKEGQHINRDGAEKALEIFHELLNLPNSNIQTKWLYNIAQMTLGGYPESIEKPFLIDESVFESDISFPRFKEIGMSLGVGVNDISGSVVMDDFNNDNYLDLMVSSYGLDDQLHYFINNKKGGFDDATEAAGINGIWSGLNMVQADYNNDGWVDVFVLRGAWLSKDGNHPNSLLKNNGDGTFSDVTKECGLYSLFPTQTASWADFNNDGWLDLFIGNEHSTNIEAPSQLFQNNGDGTFKNVAKEKGVGINGFIKGCVWGDFNNDSYPDLYLSLINNQNFLFENGGPNNNFAFTNKAVESNTLGPKFSFPCWFFDFNQDGWEDIFVSGFDFKQFQSAAGEVAKDYLNMPNEAELPKLYRNNKNGTFTDVSKEMNIDKVLYTMGCNFGDLNNDGFPDFYAATGTPDFRSLIPNRMFLNGKGTVFYDITNAGGFGHIQKGHGVAFGDLDNDGDQDVYNVLGGSYDGDNFMNALFLNPGNTNNWIKLKLEGIKANKSAIGARVKIIASNEKGENQTFYNRLNSGGSFGANPLLIEQGLGTYNNIDRIEIIWPGQKNAQIINNVKSGSYLKITQDESLFEEINVDKIMFQEKYHNH